MCKTFSISVHYFYHYQLLQTTTASTPLQCSMQQPSRRAARGHSSTHDTWDMTRYSAVLPTCVCGERIRQVIRDGFLRQFRRLRLHLGGHVENVLFLPDIEIFRWTTSPLFHNRQSHQNCVQHTMGLL